MTSRWRERYKVHPAADVFPMMTDAELKVLGEDIKNNGLALPIVFDGGKPCLLEMESKAHWLLAGRNRLEAMERAGIPVDAARHIHHDGDPVAFIISENIHRRHLTKQQQADLIVAAVTAGEILRQDGEVSKGGRGNVNKAKAKAVEVAEANRIGKRTVERAFAKAEGRQPQKPKSNTANPSRMAPSTVDGWRKGYLNAVSIACPHLDAEREIILEAFCEIAGRRMMKVA